MVNSRSTPAAGLGVAEPRLCLDFVNTEGEVRNGPPDRLEGLELFLEWGLDNGLIDEEGARDLRSAAAGDAAGVAAFLASARELRESLYRVFSRIARGEAPPAEDLAVLDDKLADALPRLGLTWGAEGARWTLRPAAARLADTLLPVALSAADLLRSELLGRVKECGSETCSWVFIDESRNRSRRWCDMSDCGNRAKARRFYERHVRKPGSA